MQNDAAASQGGAKCLVEAAGVNKKKQLKDRKGISRNVTFFFSVSEAEEHFAPLVHPDPSVHATNHIRVDANIRVHLAKTGFLKQLKQK